MKKIYSLLLFILFAFSGAFAQSTIGTEFWLSFLLNGESTGSTQLYITSDVAATGTASMPGTGWSQNFTIPANGSVSVTIPLAQGAAIDVNNMVLNKAVKVVSNFPVAVYASNQTSASSDATVIMPVNALGDTYFVNSYTTFGSEGTYPSMFVVVGISDNTSIEIIPGSDVTGGVSAGVPFSITLNQGEVYMVKGNDDLTGTRIKATDAGNCNNFAVFGGSKCATVPVTCLFCDHLYEQMIPVKAWGKQYVTAPLMTRAADSFRVLASEDGTTVSINGGAAISLNAGEFYETVLSVASFIESNKPVSVAQYSQGTNCDGVPSDPFMIMLSPVEQVIDYVVFQAFNTPAISQFYTNIVVETPYTSLVELDGAAVTGWAAVPANGDYSYVQLAVTQGTHILTSPEGVLATVYGFGNVESYGYLAGANIQPLNVGFDIVVDGLHTAFDEFTDTLTCLQTTVNFVTNSSGISDIRWDFGDGSPAYEGNPVTNHTFPSTGDYTVTMYFMRDGSCAEESIDMIVHTYSNMPPVPELADSVVCNGVPYTFTFNIPGVTYEWQDGSTSPGYQFSATGNYSVTVTDLTGCMEIRSCHIEFVNISASTITYNISCTGMTDGRITAIPSGGHSPYLYSWGTSPEETTQTITGLDVGTYSVTVTENSGCTAETSATLNEPLPLTIAVTGIGNISCYGFDDGTVTIYPNGTAPYDIVWSDPSVSGLVPVGMAPGQYSFTVTDANGCFGDGSVTIEDVEDLVVSGTHNEIECFGYNTGEINMTVNGGVLPYYYNWSNGQMTRNLFGVPAGTYIITVTDSHSCSVASSFTITQPEELVTVINSLDVACYGDNTGQVLLNVTGGTFPFSYEWSNGSGSQSLTDVYYGMYIVTVTDAHGCIAYDYAQIYQPSFPLHGEINHADVRCFGEGNGGADLTVTGGTSPYVFEWNSGEISEDIYNLIPGIYMVSITDFNGCVTADTVQIFQPEAPVSGNIYGNDVTCNGGEDGNIYTSISGGRQSYYFEWNTGSWQQNLIGVEAGIYSVTVTDNSGCKFFMSYEVSEPDPFYLQPMDNVTICYGMTAEIGIGIISGSVPPYTILWSNDDMGMTTLVNPLETAVYSAHVTDSANCISEDIDIVVTVHDSLSMQVVAAEDIVCPETPVSFNVDIRGGGIDAGSVYVNDSLMTIPVVLEITSDTLLNFVVYDACNFDSVKVTVPVNTYPLPPVDISAFPASGCAPLQVQFAENSEDMGQRYIWNFDDGDFENLSFDKYPLHTFYNPHTYNVNLQVISAEGCKNDSTTGIIVFPVPEADFRASQSNVSLAYPLVYFTNYSDGGFWYNWDFGDGNTSNVSDPEHSYSEAGVYDVVLSAVSLYGCADTAISRINVNDELAIYAPTAFTPNYDDINEEFKVILSNIDFETYRLTIFSRWGEVVFNSEDYEEAWDGRYNNMACNPGVYTWILTFEDLYGNQYTKAGYFTLIR